VSGIYHYVSNLLLKIGIDLTDVKNPLLLLIFPFQEVSFVVIKFL
jgi:hypothetical protein